MSEFSGVQHELPLPFPDLSGDIPLLPVRMVNEYEYWARTTRLRPSSLAV